MYGSNGCSGLMGVVGIMGVVGVVGYRIYVKAQAEQLLVLRNAMRR